MPVIARLRWAPNASTLVLIRVDMVASPCRIEVWAVSIPLPRVSTHSRLGAGRVPCRLCPRNAAQGYTTIIGRRRPDLRPVFSGQENRPTAEAVGLFRSTRCETKLAEKGEDALRSRVGLGQDGFTSLLEDTRLGEVHHFRGHIHVADAAFRSGDVLLRNTQVGDRMLEAVLGSTQDTTLVGHRLDGRIERGQVG